MGCAPEGLKGKEVIKGYQGLLRKEKYSFSDLFCVRT